MSELLEIIISAVDQATDVFQGINDTVSTSADAIQTEFEQATAEVERLTEELAAIYMGDVEGDAEAVEAALAAAEAEAERLGQALDNVEQESEETKDSIDGMADLMSFQQISEWVTQLADAMWEVADKAGTVQDSWTRMGLAAEGAGIPVDQMKNSVSELSSETGRAGGNVREAFIAMSSAGVTELSAMESAFKGAAAQSFILGTDVDSLVNKFSGMAMKSSIAERTLKGTGITVDELGTVLGLQGATIDEVNAKWETMDTNARMAALGQASAMNEGKEANDEYKHSWEGLQAQIDIAKGKLETLLGNVLLPVLVPALEAAARVLGWLGDTFKAVMDGPLGGFISIIGSAGAGLILLLGAVTAVSAGMGFFTASLFPAIAASWALIAPWLPFIAIGAAIVAVVYEIGKSFGWWSDASSMIDAIGAGLQKLWDAFINHPDVQAAITVIGEAFNSLWNAIQQAGQAVMDFFGISESGDFDIVNGLIMGIGGAWDTLKGIVTGVGDTFTNVYTTIVDTFTGIYDAVVGAFMAIYEAITGVLNSIYDQVKPTVDLISQTIISAWSMISSYLSPIFSSINNLVVGLIGIFNQFRSGQIDLPTAVIGALTMLWNGYNTIMTQIAQLVLRIARQVISYGLRMGSQFMNNIMNYIRQLPGKIYSALISVVSRIVSAGSQWVSNARSQASNVVNTVYNTLSSIPGKISSALSGVVSAITKPFEDAYNKVASKVDQIKDKVSEISGGVIALAGEGFEEMTPTPTPVNDIIETNTISTNDSIEVEENINIVLDFKNVPANMDQQMLMEALTDKGVISALVNNTTFQDLDAKVKERITLKANRTRGI